MKNCYHIYRGSKKNNNKDLVFIFFDTEANRKKTLIGEKQTLKLGTAIYWEVATGHIEKFRFTDNNKFYDWVERHFNVQNKEIYLVAHNVSYDAKITDMYNQLFVRRGWQEKMVYFQGKVFLIDVIKDKYNLHIMDSINLFGVSLKKIGESMKIPKLKMPDENEIIEKWFIYCERDTFILLKLFQFLLKLLDNNNLGSFKKTISGLSQNIYKSSFYDVKNNPIYIHNSTNASRLETWAFRGGFTDLLQYGKITDSHNYKVDVTSQYPSIMFTKRLPSKLLNFFGDYNRPQNEFKNVVDKLLKNKNTDTFILHADYYIPRNCIISTKGYVDKHEKLIILTGNLRLCLTEDEVKYILKKGGKVLHYYEISIYKTTFLFKSMIEHFAKMKTEAKKNGDEMVELFAKIVQNSLYGRFGMKKTKAIVIDKTINKGIDRKLITEYNEKTDETITYTGYQFGNDVIAFVKTDERTYDSFIAIPAFIASFGRLQIVSMLEVAKVINCFYIDTDAIVVNSIGYNKLNNAGFIHPTKLGLMKIEAESPKNIIDSFYNAKFYKFGNEKLVCKGIKKDATLIYENKDKMIFVQDNWMQTKTAFRRGLINSQIIEMQIKRASLKYDKGKILKNHRIQPYYIKKGEIKNE